MSKIVFSFMCNWLYIFLIFYLLGGNAGTAPENTKAGNHLSRGSPHSKSLKHPPSSSMVRVIIITIILHFQTYDLLVTRSEHHFFLTWTRFAEFALAVNSLKKTFSNPFCSFLFFNIFGQSCKFDSFDETTCI